jgi:hypothetical protein
LRARGRLRGRVSLWGVDGGALPDVRGASRGRGQPQGRRCASPPCCPISQGRAGSTSLGVRCASGGVSMGVVRRQWGRVSPRCAACVGRGGRRASAVGQGLPSVVGCGAGSRAGKKFGRRLGSGRRLGVGHCTPRGHTAAQASADASRQGAVGRQQPRRRA